MFNDRNKSRWITMVFLLQNYFLIWKSIPIIFYSSPFLLQLFKCLNQLAICQGVVAVRKQVDVFCNQSDAELEKWKENLELMQVSVWYVQWLWT